MSESCSHDHNHRPGEAVTRQLSITFVLVSIYFVAELVGGLWTGSLALLADASHMFSDLAALALSLFAAWIARRPGSSQQTYGYHRAEILAAAANGASLFLVAGGIMREAWERFGNPSEILAGPMLWIAIGGLVVNLISLMVLHGDHDHNLNVRGAWLHVLGDTLGSVGVIIAAFLVWRFNWFWADPVASVCVCLLVLFSSWRLLRESIGILMEHAPADISVEDVESRLLGQDGVESVHCLHVWLIASGLKALSAHLVVNDEVDRTRLLQTLQQQFREEFGIVHTTIQIESSAFVGCEEAESISCIVTDAVTTSHSH